ncbi:cytochrome c oxidase subunit II [Hephaestia sp. GCM10023244]|uniref:cytochrome c oxidase subunit II n=1 Tax=unclassified Hephaestia TaxID=2631281 RepID=UPI00207743A4|nr:cytochrome c oxidase subunit II [Hephaestia sp. MAHUQ-44]MCM8732366.1 cytochrome c oxidase subunit II [Hephaestia sp. MAHUQ-44]
MLKLLGLNLPEAWAHAAHVDQLIGAFSVLILLLAGPVIVLMFAFGVRYRRGKQVNREHAPNRNVALEVSWTILPFLLILGFFIVSAKMFFTIHEPPADAMSISVVAKQWMWKFQHPEGQAEIDTLHIPAGQPVKLTMTSQDVIHSLYIPALRLKQDVLPGRYTQLWFTADRPGTYHLFCSQFCGLDHAMMGGTFVVLPPGAYARWLAAQASGGSLASAGADLYRRLGCGACHRPDAAASAPRLVGLHGSTVTLASGQRVIADDQYLRDSILDPNAQETVGYKPIMPTYRGVIGEEEAMQLVAYIRSLKSVPGESR